MVVKSKCPLVWNVIGTIWNHLQHSNIPPNLTHSIILKHTHTHTHTLSLSLSLSLSSWFWIFRFHIFDEKIAICCHEERANICFNRSHLTKKILRQFNLKDDCKQDRSRSKACLKWFKYGQVGVPTRVSFPRRDLECWYLRKDEQQVAMMR